MNKLKEDDIYSCGTIHKDRLRGLKLSTEKEMRKKSRGSHIAQHDSASDVNVIQWFDNKSVLAASNFLSINPIVDVKRWDKKAKKYIHVPRPNIVGKYNRAMGGTDLYDMLMALYKVDHKSRKWYRCVFFWILSTCAVQGWLYYK